MGRPCHSHPGPSHRREGHPAWRLHRWIRSFLHRIWPAGILSQHPDAQLVVHVCPLFLAASFPYVPLMQWICPIPSATSRHDHDGYRRRQSMCNESGEDDESKAVFNHIGCDLVISRFLLCSHYWTKILQKNKPWEEIAQCFPWTCIFATATVSQPFIPIGHILQFPEDGSLLEGQIGTNCQRLVSSN